MPQRKRSATRSAPRRPSTPAPAFRDDEPPVATTHIDLRVARGIFDRLRPRAEALPASALVPVTFSLGQAATTALAVASRCNQSPLRGRFEALERAKVWSVAHLDDLPDVAVAAYYVDLRAHETEALDTGAMLPQELAEEASGLRSRMLRVLDFLFDDHHEVGPLLKRLRASSGYRPLAGTLLRCADLYGQHPAEVAAVPKHYRPADQADAVRVANLILTTLDAQEATDAERWSQMRQRMATLLLTVYGEVADAGRFLERAEKLSLDERYPSLVRAGRNAARAEKADPSPDPPPAPPKPE